MVMENDHPSPLEPREPKLEDLVSLCRELNKQQARYVVIGGFAMRAAGGHFTPITIVLPDYVLGFARKGSIARISFK